jgi:hypothetical protein
MKIVPPNRVERRYVQHLVAPPAQVMPLLCPVREADWIPGWDPLLVVSASRLTIRLQATAGGCDAEVVYAHTSLGPAGDAFVAGFTEAHYRGFMQDWEAKLNHYLRHGRARGDGDGDT